MGGEIVERCGREAAHGLRTPNGDLGFGVPPRRAGRWGVRAVQCVGIVSGAPA